MVGFIRPPKWETNLEGFSQLLLSCAGSHVASYRQLAILLEGYPDAVARELTFHEPYLLEQLQSGHPPTLPQAVRQVAECVDKPAAHIRLDMSRNFLEHVEMVPVLTSFAGPLLLPVVAARIRVVCLSSNELQSLPASLVTLPNLEELVLDHNRICTLTYTGTSLTECCPKLEVLDLRNNRLEDLQGLAYLLDNHPTLARLSLSCNQIDHIQSDQLPTCPELFCLGLFANRLGHSRLMYGSRPEPAFVLRTMLASLATAFPKVTDLYLLGNPMSDKTPLGEYHQEVMKAYPSVRYIDCVKVPSRPSHLGIGRNPVE